MELFEALKCTPHLDCPVLVVRCPHPDPAPALSPPRDGGPRPPVRATRQPSRVLVLARRHVARGPGDIM